MTDTARTDPAVRELPLAPDGEIEIFLTSNELRLRGTDTNRVLVRALGGRSLEGEFEIESAAAHVRIRDAGGEVRLGPLRVRSGRATDLEIELPRTARVNVRTMSGDVDATGVGGASRWASASGDLRLRLDGGPVSVESMSGDVALDCSATIALTARSVSGTLRLRAPRIETLSASTTSGDIEVDAALAAGAEHVLSSVSGDVRLATGSDVRLEAQTVAGGIRASVPHRAEGGHGRRTIVVGDGSVRVSVRTMSGDVSLRGAAPEPPTANDTEAVAVTIEPPDIRPPDPVAPPPPDSEPPVVVAEASAAPNLVRVPLAPAPADDLDAGTGATLGEASATDRREQARLDVLKALERGDLDVESAFRRLEAIEDTGPRAFRGWC